MTEREDTKQDTMIQNLRDAGCDEGQIHCFLQFLDDGRCWEALQLLEKHRQVLLERCHEEEYKIDCLDYLTYQMGQKKR